MRASLEKPQDNEQPDDLQKEQKAEFEQPEKFLSIGIHAHGVVAIGVSAHGVFSLGILSHGLVSVGVIAMGICSAGLVSMGLLSAGLVSMGLRTFGPHNMDLSQPHHGEVQSGEVSPTEPEDMNHHNHAH